MRTAITTEFGCANESPGDAIKGAMEEQRQKKGKKMPCSGGGMEQGG